MSSTVTTPSGSVFYDSVPDRVDAVQNVVRDYEKQLVVILKPTDRAQHVRRSDGFGNVVEAQPICRKPR